MFTMYRSTIIVWIQNNRDWPSSSGQNSRGYKVNQLNTIQFWSWWPLLLSNCGNYIIFTKISRKWVSSGRTNTPKLGDDRVDHSSRKLFSYCFFFRVGSSFMMRWSGQDWYEWVLLIQIALSGTGLCWLRQFSLNSFDLHSSPNDFQWGRSEVTE